MNIYRSTPENKLEFLIAKRSLTKAKWPGCYDNPVAGGLAHNPEYETPEFLEKFKLELQATELKNSNSSSSSQIFNQKLTDFILLQNMKKEATEEAGIFDSKLLNQITKIGTTSYIKKGYQPRIQINYKLKVDDNFTGFGCFRKLLFF